MKSCVYIKIHGIVCHVAQENRVRTIPWQYWQEKQICNFLCICSSIMYYQIYSVSSLHSCFKFENKIPLTIFKIWASKLSVKFLHCFLFAHLTKVIVTSKHVVQSSWNVEHCLGVQRQIWASNLMQIWKRLAISLEKWSQTFVSPIVIIMQSVSRLNIRGVPSFFHISIF